MEESKENELNEDEREAVNGLSADAKNVYQMVRDKLKSFKNKLVGRSSSVGAVLLARHAEIIARKMRAITGKTFTEMDYYRTWVALRYARGRMDLRRRKSGCRKKPSVCSSAGILPSLTRCYGRYCVRRR